MRTRLLHATAATVALALIAVFWTSTLVSELFLDQSSVLAVKHAIAWYGLGCLVLAMIATGASGFVLGRQRAGGWVEEKKKRMPLIGMNGVLVMMPAALFLHHKAAAGEWDGLFYAVQAVELLAGAAQLTWMSKSFYTGLRLTGRVRPARNSVAFQAEKTRT